jgi:hypothetical protein
VECKGSNICEHNKHRDRCVECKGNKICEHKKEKFTCIKCNPIGNFINRQRVYINDVLLSKNRGTNKYIGCSNVFLYQHIKSKMKDNMIFENIHIDHIKPISKFDLTNDDEIRRCFHWSNLQPLLIKDNLTKSNKWSDEDEENWIQNIIKI